MQKTHVFHNDSLSFLSRHRHRLFWGCGLLLLVFVSLSLSLMGCGLTERHKFKDVPCASSGCHGDLFRSNFSALPSHNDKPESIPAPGEDCSSCHGQASWVPEFHKSSSLVGVHKKLACSKCHKSEFALSGQATKPKQDCLTCHAGRYKPEVHVQAGTSLECGTCHKDQITFKFTHKFSPLGRHSDSKCNLCHATTKFVKADSKKCVSCHLEDYDKITKHKELGLSTDCVACHTQTKWPLNHEKLFPIKPGGNHSAYEKTCSSCHKNSKNYKEFTCINCHDGRHQKAKMDEEHQGETRDGKSYSYESKACFGCHKDGKK